MLYIGKLCHTFLLQQNESEVSQFMGNTLWSLLKLNGSNTTPHSLLFLLRTASMTMIKFMKLGMLAVDVSKVEGGGCQNQVTTKYMNGTTL